MINEEGIRAAGFPQPNDQKETGPRRGGPEGTYPAGNEKRNREWRGCPAALRVRNAKRSLLAPGHKKASATKTGTG